MSKRVYVKILLLMALALATACSKEMDTPSPAPAVQTVHYKAAVQTGADTRATVGTDLKYEYEEGDKVYLESEDGKLYGFLSLAVSGGIGKDNALFEGDLTYVGEEPLDNPSVTLVLVSKEDDLHKTGEDGKLVDVDKDSYLKDKWAPSLAKAVSHLSHFTGTGKLNDYRFTLHQQSTFLNCFVRLKAEQAPVDKTVEAQLLNSNNDVLRQASIKVSEVGAVPFVFAFLGGESLEEGTKLVMKWGESESDGASFDLSSSTLAANKYYTVSRSTLSFDGFHIKAISNNTKITFKYNYDDSGIEYSLDFGESWIHYTGPFTLNKDEVACIKGNRTDYKNEKPGDTWWKPQDKPIFVASSKCYIGGNIMSLLKDEVLSVSAFQGAFSRGDTQLTYIDIDPDSPLILPATDLVERCYMSMFRNCTSLTRAPVFRVETTAEKCCYNMFRQCSNLTDLSGIDLPAQTLAEDCYRELFRLCTSITSVSSSLLPSTSLAANCYQQMFNGCSKLQNSPNLPALTLADHCYDTMFSGCSVLSAAPELRATNLVSYCYYQMFYGCNLLTEIKCWATSGIGANNSTTDWVKNITTTGTFYKAADASWTKGNSGYPSNWSLEPLP